MMTCRLRTRPRVHAEDGNLVLAMLVVLMVAGLAATLFSYVVMGNRTTRGDRNFQTAVNGAEAGLQSALTAVTTGGDSLSSPQIGTGTIEGVDYEWEATRVDATRWDVWAEGVVNGVVRRLEADVVQSSTFRLGAFADVAIHIRGGSTSLSYDSRTGATNTGLGSVGSNGVVDIVGGAYSDEIYLFGDAVCQKAGCNESGTTIVGSEDPFDIEGVKSDIQEAMDAACAGQTFTSWKASTSEPLQGGQTYCFSSMLFDVKASDYTWSGATSENPAIVYLTGMLDVENDVSINCPGCATNPTTATPEAPAFRVYSTGNRVEFGNQTNIAMLLAAPDAACQGSPSSAQLNFYGSMVCGDASNQGAWNYYFDLAATDLAEGDWDLDTIREEVSP